VRTSALHAAGTIGVPVFLATVALVTGFGVLGTSEFVPTATFGTLVAATLVVGTLVNLTILPAMIGKSEV
jgi:predicted RND superfamily exporter protein